LIYISLEVLDWLIVKKKRAEITSRFSLAASMANAAAAPQGKARKLPVTRSDSSKNMTPPTVYAVMNIISFICTIPQVSQAGTP
jgi:hypothetical protein